MSRLPRLFFLIIRLRTCEEYELGHGLPGDPLAHQVPLGRHRVHPEAREQQKCVALVIIFLKGVSRDFRPPVFSMIGTHLGP